MSTSSSPTPEPMPGPLVESFTYVELPALSADTDTGSRSAQLPERDLAIEASKRDSAIKEQARQEGEAQARADYELQLTQIRESLRDSLAAFAQERRTYYQQVEGEVVRLALSIARKVLHRESQLDPLLLAGMVHVALQKIESGTKTTMRVHPQQVSEFRSYFAHHMETQDAPEVLEDAAVAKECCVLQTTVGTTEIGINAQLKEIEQGLCDLLASRPEASK
jgi:flagellar assembly protein FliH